jgi:probable DNA metabolism protein
LVDQKNYQPQFFSNDHHVISDDTKYVRVIKGLKQKLKSDQLADIYRIYLSEDAVAHQACFEVIQKVFQQGAAILDNYGDAQVLYLSQTLKKVSRERHRMKAFIRFSKSDDGLYFCVIEPDFNVLPLISSFFKKRYADQAWLIYDIKRGYGLLYDKQRVVEVNLTEENQQLLNSPAIAIQLDERDAHFQHLWKQYFKSTNIEARRNMKLHLQHVPRRYWKYLVEKQ